MLHQNLSNRFLLRLLLLFISTLSILAYADPIETHLNKELCRYVAAGTSKIFQKEKIDFCKCLVVKETFHCKAQVEDQASRIPRSLEKFSTKLPKGSSKLNSFIYLFASTENCDIKTEDGVKVGCCMIYKSDKYDIRPSVQLGIVTSLGLELDSEVSRYVDWSEYKRSQNTYFPSEGAGALPAHCFRDFSIKLDSPAVFKAIRSVLKIDEIEFMFSIGNSENELRNLGKLGGSGNGFYLTYDDKYFIKTTKRDEYENLIKILPDYFQYIQKNHSSLLSRFLSTFEYKSSLLELGYIITNNLLPSTLDKPQIFDLKGSRVNRKVSKKDKETKKSPTLKDLDFMEVYPEGLFISRDNYAKLERTIRSDVEFLASHNCMDYSLLIAVTDIFDGYTAGETENLYVISAQTKDGKKKTLHIGIIDILQPYTGSKKIETSIKSILNDKSAVSIIEPSAYAERYERFILDKVFHPIN